MKLTKLEDFALALVTHVFLSIPAVNPVTEQYSSNVVCNSIYCIPNCVV